ncbi:ABC transporter ATP-binding protein [Albimonas pacifica]|uniref:Putative spermidine/putrescine transport system ATP-binding protein n=1 Tax=Albimonas pacifica TaxID=1114924 RepID=A0A1I3BKK7_9RHOB|nr:ABC transporter ATP-binding protein [Albimonas pacifica]SFH62700.1 putative spermidine/putrescine transport system ATP-binding protein [Albimonas pacifica]
MTDPSRLGAPVRFEGVGKRYGRSWAVRGFDLEIAAGEFVSLLGASGSGKTTSLMMLAGFETPTEGRIAVGGRTVDAMPPAKRDIGMVFQSYALFPHMTAAENVDFPLRMRGRPKAEREAAVAKMLDIVGLAHLADRLPSQLSGGQQQRVALARAIVFEPPVLLMDEPLGALDKHLRATLQAEIKRIQARLGLTVLFVTHDQEEALTMSDRICVMRDGAILQVDAPETIYDRPADTYVAAFFGESNALTAVPEGPGAVRLGPVVAPWPGAGPAAGALEIAIRPERIAIADEDAPVPPAHVAVFATVRETTFVGDRRVYLAALDTGEAVQVNQPLADLSGGHRPGERVRLHWATTAMRGFVDGRAA